MNEAKDCKRRATNRLLVCLGFCACSLLTGCSGFGGLQSVGAWPPLAHLWERQPPSPSPENDSYAQVMRPTLGLNTKLADAKKQPPTQGSNDGSSGLTDGNPSGTAIANRTTAGDQTDGSHGLQVTLGRPEPLPGLSPGSDSEQTRLAASVPPTWRPTGDEPDAADAPALAGPAPVIAADNSLPEDLRSPPAVPARKEAAAPAAEHVPAQLALGSPAEAAPDLNALASGEPADPPARADASVILAKAQAKLRSMDAYQVKMQRRERVGGSVLPEEELVLSIRAKPKAVRLEWVNGSSKGREVIFSPSLDEKMIYVHQPGAAAVLPSVRIAVDNPLVMKNSRHTIAEAGFEMILANLQKSKTDQEGGAEAGVASLEYKGLEKAAGVDRPCHHFVRHTPSGETWNVYLDPRSLLPRLVLAEDKQGELLERYVYSEVRENPKELTTAAAFSPSERWGDGKGLFSRIARAAAGSNVPTNSAPATR